MGRNRSLKADSFHCSATCPPATNNSIPVSDFKNDNPSLEKYLPPDPANVTLALNCGRKNPVELPYPTQNNLVNSYNLTCGEDCSGQDLFAIWAYSLDHCVNACRYFYHGGSSKISIPANIECQAVAFKQNMDSGDVTRHSGNCFLKTNCSEPYRNVAVARAILNL